MLEEDFLNRKEIKIYKRILMSVVVIGLVAFIAMVCIALS